MNGEEGLKDQQYAQIKNDLSAQYGERLRAQREESRKEMELVVARYENSAALRLAEWNFYGKLLFAVVLVVCVAVVSCASYNIEYLKRVKPEVVPQLVWPTNRSQ